MAVLLSNQVEISESKDSNLCQITVHIYIRVIFCTFHSNEVPKILKTQRVTAWMVKYCMLKTSVVKQILIYSVGQTYMTGSHTCVLWGLSSSLFFVCMCPKVCGSLWQGFQDGIHLLCYRCQCKLKLVLKRRKERKKRGGSSR